MFVHFQRSAIDLSMLDLQRLALEWYSEYAQNVSTNSDFFPSKGTPERATCECRELCVAVDANRNAATPQLLRDLGV
jgi:hypothetical protein